MLLKKKIWGNFQYLPNYGQGLDKTQIIGLKNNSWW